ncbi:MAG: hypothetical protein WA988_07445, partial [Candidatus Nanopelagicales bacterium]
MAVIGAGQAGAGSVGMPANKFSMVILGGLWPVTPTSLWQSTLDAMHQKGIELSDSAQMLRSKAQNVLVDNSGRFAEALQERYFDDSKTLENFAEVHFAWARVDQRVIDLIESAREVMVGIDSDAHEQIDGILRQCMGTPAAVTVPAQVQ